MNNHGYQPKGPRIDPRQVFEPGQPASGVQPPAWPKGWTVFLDAQDDKTRQRFLSEHGMTDTQPAPDPDSTAAHLTACVAAMESAIEHLKLACLDPLVDEALGEFTVDAMRGIRDEVESERRDGRATN